MSELAWADGLKEEIRARAKAAWRAAMVAMPSSFQANVDGGLLSRWIKGNDK